MRIDVFHHIDSWNEVMVRLDEIKNSITNLENRVNNMGITLTEIQDAVTAENTVIDSAIVLLQGLAEQIAALAPTQAAIDALALEVRTKTQVLADAVVANT
jgi:uncharacterized coiled-coil protein SlyX